MYYKTPFHGKPGQWYWNESSPSVIANTPVIQPGETAPITIEVPDEPGEYSYICTIPGHWRNMQGTLVVKP